MACLCLTSDLGSVLLHARFVGHLLFVCVSPFFASCVYACDKYVQTNVCVCVCVCLCVCLDGMGWDGMDVCCVCGVCPCGGMEGWKQAMEA